MPKKTEKLPDQYAQDLLDLVVENIAYFEKKPVHLAWVMMHYEALHRAARRAVDDWTNPKDAILDLKGVTQTQQDLIYDAWGITVSNEPEFPDRDSLPLERKCFKTMNDWIALKTDPNYRYRSIYPDVHAVYNHLLCVIGTGMKWVRHNGVSYIADVGPSGVNDCIFAGYTKVGPKVREGIREAVLKICDRYGTLDYVKEAIENGIKSAQGWRWQPSMDKKTWEHVPPGQTAHDKLIANATRLTELMAQLGEKAQKDEKAKEILQSLGAIRQSPEEKKRKQFGKYYQLCEYSNLITMPEDAHPSYRHAALRIVCEILLSPNADKNNVATAWKWLKSQKAPFDHWHPTSILGQLSETPGRLPTRTRRDPVTYKVGDWVAFPQSRKPQFGIVTRLARSKKFGKFIPLFGGPAGKIPFVWETDVDIYDISGKKVGTEKGTDFRHWERIDPPAFPIQTDERGQWRSQLNFQYHLYPLPEYAVERWHDLTEED